MPIESADLHGNAPDQCSVALLVVDVINDLEFEGGERLLRHALPVAARIAALADRARRRGVPVVYVNDNFGKWRASMEQQLHHCLADGVRGRPVAALLAPHDEDYVVLKPKHSGFFATGLELLLRHLGAETLVIAGLTGDRCVLFTAQDAFLRDFRLVLPRDAIASIDPRSNARALAFMERTLSARIVSSTGVRFPPRKTRGKRTKA